MAENEIFKSGKMSVDVAPRTVGILKTSIQFSTQDQGTAKLIFSLSKDGLPLPLSSAATAKIFLRMADGSVFEKTVSIVDQINGKLEYVLEEEISHPGLAKGELNINYANGQALSVCKFSFNIDASLMDQDIVPLAEYYVKDFNTLQSDIEQRAAVINVTVDEMQAKVDEFESTAVTLDPRLTTVEEKVATATVQLAETATEIGPKDTLPSWMQDNIRKVTKYLDDYAREFGINIAQPPYNASITPGVNNAAAIQNAINDARAKGSGKVYIPNGKFEYSTTLNLPENVDLIGSGDVANSSVLNYKGTGYAIVTSGNHQRNKFRHFKIDTNGNSSGIRLGDIHANLPVGITPITFALDTVSVTNVASGFNGIEMINVSHINMMGVRMGYGSLAGGGTGLKITADYWNSGVFVATDCTFGRVDNNHTGLLIDAPINLDSYTFTGCYFGGEKPIRLIGSNYVRSVNFIGCHAEARKLPGSVETDVIVIEVGAVLGGSWTGGSITAFGSANSSAFVFTDRTKKFNVFAVEANALTEAVFKNKGATIIEGCILQEGNIANGATATQYVGIPDGNLKYGASILTIENLRVKYQYSVTGATKEYWASAPDKTLGHSRGDIVKNTVPYKAKNITHWKCETAGIANAAFIAYGTGWGNTAEKNALTLTVDDKGYWFKNTETGSMQMWDGTAWI